LEEAQLHFMDAVSIENGASAETKITVKNKDAILLGYLVRTSPTADYVNGYAGPTECLMSLEKDGLTVRKVTLRKSYDTPSYVEQVTTDAPYLSSFAGRTLATLAGLDYERDHIEGVSGSTRTSYAIAESLKQRAEKLLQPATVAPPMLLYQNTDWVVLTMLVGGIFLAHSPWRGHVRVRLAWHWLLVLALGVGTGKLISLAGIIGWAQHGIAWRLAPGLVLLTAVALVFPWATKRQVYCHHVCPHGAAQALVGRLSIRKIILPERWHRWLKRLPGLLLLGILLCVVCRTQLQLTTDVSLLEPFDAWGGPVMLGIPLMLAVLGCMASAWVPMAYCHYGCPTGALLKYVRSKGRYDRLGPADLLAGLLVLLITGISR
jgi:hypothetical protein